MKIVYVEVNIINIRVIKVVDGEVLTRLVSITPGHVKLD